MRIYHRGVNSRIGSTQKQKSAFATRHYNPITVRRNNAQVTQVRDSVYKPPAVAQTRRIIHNIPIINTRRIMPMVSGAFQNQKRYFSTRYYNPIYRRTLRHYR